MSVPQKRIHPLLVLALGAAASVLFTGCPPTGLLCDHGLTACGQSLCANLTDDDYNCGGCGIACSANQQCQNSKCVCAQDTVSCGGSCIVPSDPNYCGGCPATGTVACQTAQVCEDGACKTSCEDATSTLCGRSCVNVETDTRNCGACGNACASKQSCHAGVCAYDVVLACFSTGKVVGLQESTSATTPGVLVGTGPISLGVMSNVLLALDSLDQHLYEATLGSFTRYTETPEVEVAANHLLVDGNFAYVVNSGTETLEVLQRNGTAITPPNYSGVTPDAGVLDGGLGLVPVAEISLGGGSAYAQTVTKDGTHLYVPLNGTGMVVEVDVSNPLAPHIARTFDLNGLDLHPTGGGPDVPAPTYALVRNGQLYVTLSNLGPDYLPGGDGILAKVNLADAGVSEVDLGSDACLNAAWMGMSTDGGALYVSCSGTPTYVDPSHANQNYQVKSIDKAGILALDQNDTRQGAWSPCANGAAVDGGCQTFTPNRFAVRNGKLYVGDTSYGRLAIIQANGTALTESLGYQNGAAPVQACDLNSAGYGNVADVLSLP